MKANLGFASRFARFFAVIGGRRSLGSATVVMTTALLGFAAPASANIVIDATFDSSITTNANAAGIEAGINQAINFYQTNITTPITVAITFQDVNTGLGASATYNSTLAYNLFQPALASHATSADDATALANSVPAGTNNPVDGDSNIMLSLPNARALGFSNFVPPAGQADSTISLNTSIMNIPGNAYDPAKYSFLGVVEHEVDEVLGLGSRLDSFSTTGPVKPEDLFRYASDGNRSYTVDANATPYFSIDGGATNLVGFNQSTDGSDHGDWITSGTTRVQDAFGTPGSTVSLNANSVELRALDVIGYTLNTNVTAVPEPSTWALVFASAVVLGGYRSARYASSRMIRLRSAE